MKKNLKISPFTYNLKDIPFVTTYKCIDHEKVVTNIHSKLLNIQSRNISQVFKKTKMLFFHKRKFYIVEGQSLIISKTQYGNCDHILLAD